MKEHMSDVVKGTIANLQAQKVEMKDMLLRLSLITYNDEKDQDQKVRLSRFTTDVDLIAN